MREKSGQVFSIAAENAPVPGCTTSREVEGGENSIVYFSLAGETDISAEMHPCRKLILVAEGQLEIYGTGHKTACLQAGDGILLAADLAAGMRTATGAVYTEVRIRKEDHMNELMKAGEVFRLAELIPYQEGKIVNMDLAHGEGMKFALMAFDAGSELPEHAAPGEALVFALDGRGVIGYEGKEYPIQAGENFHFAKGGKHFVRAEERFKMALLLTLQ